MDAISAMTHLEITANHLLWLCVCLQMVASGLVGLWVIDRQQDTRL